MSPASRSIFGVIDGLLLFLALEGAFYAIAFLGLHHSFDTPTRLYLSCNLVWAIVAAGLSGYATARIARRSPIAHGVALAIPFVLLSAFNLNKGVGGRRTPFVLAFNVFVPLAFIWGAFAYARRRERRRRPRQI